jgi:hypothetical protein
MREAEIAAITEHFFESEFTEEYAVGLLGQATERQEHEGREWVFLRPDARSLARVDLAIRPPREGESIRGEDGELYAAEPFIEELVLVLRGPVPYLRSTLESWFGPGRLGVGPENEDGEASTQIEYDYVGTYSGQVIIRWWREPSDPPNMGRPNGPDEVRVEEVHLRRPYPSDADEEEVDAEEIDDEIDGDAVEEHDASEHTVMTDSMLQHATIPPVDHSPTHQQQALNVKFSLDEAMDSGVWMADLAWKILRQDFTIDRALDVLGTPESPMGGDGEAIQLNPKDERLEAITIVPRGERVAHAVLHVVPVPPLVIATDALTDRFGAEPTRATGAVTWRLEGTRSRGSVVVRGSEVRAGCWVVSTVDLLRN